MEGREVGKEMEELCKKLIARVCIEDIRKVKTGRVGNSELLAAKLGSEDEKRDFREENVS